ncbi:unnamed protein product [Amoebophrya sp. A120]|nr:unnamed protein product [Amoebophrya sp. A120]|eukprot:GSA120T00000961001.1
MEDGTIKIPPVFYNYKLVLGCHSYLKALASNRNWSLWTQKIKMTDEGPVQLENATVQDDSSFDSSDIAHMLLGAVQNRLQPDTAGWVGPVPRGKSGGEWFVFQKRDPSDENSSNLQNWHPPESATKGGLANFYNAAANAKRSRRRNNNKQERPGWMPEDDYEKLKAELHKLSEKQKREICNAYIYRTKILRDEDDEQRAGGETAAEQLMQEIGHEDDRQLQRTGGETAAAEQLMQEIGLGDVIPPELLLEKSNLHCYPYAQEFVENKSLCLWVGTLRTDGQENTIVPYELSSHTFYIAQLLLGAVLQQRVANPAGWVGPVNVTRKKKERMYAFRKRDCWDYAEKPSTRELQKLGQEALALARPQDQSQMPPVAPDTPHDQSQMRPVAPDQQDFYNYYNNYGWFPFPYGMTFSYNNYPPPGGMSHGLNYYYPPGPGAAESSEVPPVRPPPGLGGIYHSTPPRMVRRRARNAGPAP